MKNLTTTPERPFSPHVSIYRWPITMAMSIAHRISGAALYFGTFFFAVWLIGVAYGGDTFGLVNAVYASFVGRSILFLYTFALVHHLVGGLRHLFWDVRTALLEKRCAARVAGATVFVSIILTFLIWIISYAVL